MKKLLLLTPFQAIAWACGSCKAIPHTLSWPSIHSWQKLNTSTSGRLLAPPAPGAACHPDQPTFDNATCNYITTAWPNSTFHANNPISVDFENWTNDSCLIDPAAPCSGAGYPVFVINSTTAHEVSAGVDFARENTVRLIVKGTGHDYLGRSAAPNSLSIWTRYIRGFTFHDNFKPYGCGYNLNLSAVTIGAGELMGDVYLATASHNLTIVGGLNQDVGLGGYLSGGGHGPLSAAYGLAADQVLELEVVTPDGEIVKVNECQQSDLFWALRGGGGSTFGVVTSATVRTFPTPSIGMFEFKVTFLKPASDSYWESTTYFHKQIARMVDGGLSGYYSQQPAITNLAANKSSQGWLSGTFIVVDKASSVAAEVMTPIMAHINSTYVDDLEILTVTHDFDDFYEWWFSNRDASTVGYDGALGSRLLNADVLSAPSDIIMETLKAATPTYPGEGLIGGCIVSGPSVWNATPRGGGNSVNPAWRNGTVDHLVVTTLWPSLNSSAQIERQQLLTGNVEALRKLAPNSGAYINEANPQEIGYQHSFWGENYSRLLKIKREVDPQDVFWCHPCVGDENWHQVDGILCRR